MSNISKLGTFITAQVTQKINPAHNGALKHFITAQVTQKK